MFVWILLARRACGELYIVGVFGKEAYAWEQASRFLRQHPAAEVTVQRFSVIDGGSCR